MTGKVKCDACARRREIMRKAAVKVMRKIKGAKK